MIWGMEVASIAIVPFVTSMYPAILVTLVDIHIIGHVAAAAVAAAVAVVPFIAVAAICPILGYFVCVVIDDIFVASATPLLFLISNTPLMMCSDSVQLMASHIELILHGREHGIWLSVLMCQCCNG